MKVEWNITYSYKFSEINIKNIIYSCKFSENNIKIVIQSY